MKGWKTLAAAAVLSTSLMAPAPARADFLESAGWGSLTVLTNVLYMPAKLVYASVGGLTGGLALACTGGDYDVASNVWTPSLGGTYVVTDRMLRGEDAIEFAGTGGGDRAVKEQTVDVGSLDAPQVASSVQEQPLSPR